MKKLNGPSNIVLVAIIAILIGGVGYFALRKIGPISYQTPMPTSTLPLLSSCKDGLEAMPVIISLSGYSGSVGTKLEIMGCNFSGFEGDKNAWIVNSQGIKGILYGEAGSTAKLLKVTLKSPLCQKDASYSGLPCDTWLALIPGAYKIYTAPWGKESNKVDFVIK